MQPERPNPHVISVPRSPIQFGQSQAGLGTIKVEQGVVHLS
jgi:hypothetical protein